MMWIYHSCQAAYYEVSRKQQTVHTPLFFRAIVDVDCWVWWTAILVPLGEYKMHVGTGNTVGVTASKDQDGCPLNSMIGTYDLMEK